MVCTYEQERAVLDGDARRYSILVILSYLDRSGAWDRLLGLIITSPCVSDARLGQSHVWMQYVWYDVVYVWFVNKMFGYSGSMSSQFTQRVWDRLPQI